MELLNTQSLTNKSLLIHDHILDRGLDFMCLVETWHKTGDHSVLNEACPQGYVYMGKITQLWTWGWFGRNLSG